MLDPSPESFFFPRHDAAPRRPWKDYEKERGDISIFFFFLPLFLEILFLHLSRACGEGGYERVELKDEASSTGSDPSFSPPSSSHNPRR